METLEHQQCPFCHKKTLTLTEDKKEIPYFGNLFIFSMNCSNCNYQKADIESEQMKDPCKYTFEITSQKDLKVRVIKSSNATVKIPQMRMSVTPGPASIGFISNIEGILQRFKKIIEDERDNADDPTIRKKAKNLLKKLWKVECGNEKLKIIIEDPSGNSAIISEKAEISKLK